MLESASRRYPISMAKIQRILKMHKENYTTLYKPHRNSQAKLNKAIFHSVEIFGTHTHTHLCAVIRYV